VDRVHALGEVVTDPSSGGIGFASPAPVHCHARGLGDCEQPLVLVDYGEVVR
jgi:hypothetical protein